VGASAVHTIPADILTPPEVFAKIRDGGKHKVLKPLSQTLIQSILAGWYVGFGSLLALWVSNWGVLGHVYPVIPKFLYGLVFPVGLILIVLLGAELFTGNCLLSTVAWLEGDCAGWRYLLSLVASWFGNLAGALILVQLAVKSHVFQADHFDRFPIALSQKKVYLLTKEQVFVRGLLGNWLVDLAIVLGTASTTFAGRAIGCFVPIFIFATMGFEHW
jgi:formate transporter